MTPAIRASQVPTPIRLVLGDICSRCGDPWTMLHGVPNLREADCIDRACPCHSPSWSSSLYEGSSPDIDLLTSSGAQE